MRYAPQLLLIGAVAAVGVLHTIVPDHWVPIALIARQRGWSRSETARASFQAGVGHVMSTLLIGVAVWLAGVAFATRFGNLVDTATSIALIGFGGWIMVGALREMHDAGQHRHAHGHSHSHDFSGSEAVEDPIHGSEQQVFSIDEGELRLSIFERGGLPAHFRLSGAPIDIARIETVRAAGERQLFRFKDCGAYWQSIEEVSEPHEFDIAVMIDHRGHAHSFDGKFRDRAHGLSGHDHGEDHHERSDDYEDGPEHDTLYAPHKGMAVGRHSHIHRHGAGAPHTHWHDHDADTLHVVLEEIGSSPPLHEHRHRTPARTALLLILGSSPMVEGIPAFFAAGKYGFGLIIVMAMVFGMSTIVAYVFLCVYSSEGLQRVSFGAFERYGEVVSGAFIALVGVIFWIFPIL
jgi:nickel/cobalt transporter (NicO) family protein